MTDGVDMNARMDAGQSVGRGRRYDCPPGAKPGEFQTQPFGRPASGLGRRTSGEAARAGPGAGQEAGVLKFEA